MSGGKIGEFPAFSDKYIPGGKYFGLCSEIRINVTYTHKSKTSF